MEKQSVNSCLESILRRHAPEFVVPPVEAEGFNAFFSALGWRLRRLAHALAGDECALLESAGLVAPGALRLDEIARIHALCCMLDILPEETHVEWFDAFFRRGDNGEREAMLCGLILLPKPERLLPTAIDACRAAVQTTFEAMACENAYPSGYFPREAFRAMVLKALHLGVPVRRIHGLEARMDAELSRMAADYAGELRVAGRAVSPDVVFIAEEKGGTTQ
jgi:hypothetical protein